VLGPGPKSIPRAEHKLLESNALLQAIGNTNTNTNTSIGAKYFRKDG
jgi:hypothetical protein